MHRNKPISQKITCYTAVLWILLGAPMICPAEEIAMPDAKPEKIYITSDRLVADQNSQFVFFSGNVKAIQGASTIFSDSLTVYYTDSQDMNAQKVAEASAKDRIVKIIATGHVRIKFDDKTAYCEQAVYMTENKSLILSGKDTRIESAGNSISGEKITVYQLTGQIMVDGSPENKVEAVFLPNENVTITDIK